MKLDRLISVLEAIAISRDCVSPSEIQKITGLPRPTCYRLLQILTDHQLLDKSAKSARYQIGTRLKQIVLMGQTDADVVNAASPILQKAANKFEEAIILSRTKKSYVEIIHIETPSNPSCSYVYPGLGYRPMHACSCSKAIAAVADEKFQEQILGGEMLSFTESTITTRATLEQEFAHIREIGYAECVEEFRKGVSSVAAPISINNTGSGFSLGASGPSQKFDSNFRASMGQNLKKISLEVAQQLQIFQNFDSI